MTSYQFQDIKNTIETYYIEPSSVQGRILQEIEDANSVNSLTGATGPTGPVYSTFAPTGPMGPTGPVTLPVPTLITRSTTLQTVSSTTVQLTFPSSVDIYTTGDIMKSGGIFTVPVQGLYLITFQYTRASRAPTGDWDGVNFRSPGGGFSSTFYGALRLNGYLSLTTTAILTLNAGGTFDCVTSSFSSGADDIVDQMICITKIG
jgi:hypothetical protein